MLARTLDADERAALAASHFGRVPSRVLEQLLETASSLAVPGGATVLRVGHQGGLFLVVSGLLRTYLTAPNGRQVTIRYSRRGAIIGSGSIFERGPQSAAVEAVTAARLLAFSSENARRLAQNEVAVAHAFNIEMAERLAQFFAELAGNTFGSLRERLGRHLLDLAQKRDGALVVEGLSQQDLADAVGSTREAVARVMGELRREGTLRTGSSGVEIIEPERLSSGGAR